MQGEATVMVNQNSDGVPILGQKPTHFQAMTVALLTSIDENGMSAINGNPRGCFMDGAQLLDEVRHIVREELKRAHKLGYDDAESPISS